MKKPVFTGCATALATPFDSSGGVDFAALDRLIDFQIGSGVSAVVVCATTGECPTLTDGEFEAVVTAAVKCAAGRIPVLAGTGRNCTRRSLELSLTAQRCGAAGLLMVNPYYNKSTQAGICEHFDYIADRVDIPIILYSVPSRTGCPIAPESYARLARHPMIYGTKEASGDISLISKAISLTPDDFVFYSGNDDQVLPIAALGGRGVVSTLSNIAPRAMSGLCRCLDRGDLPAARALHRRLLPLIDALFCETNPIPLKYAMGRLGLCSPRVRLPLTEPSGRAKDLIDTELQNFGLLPKKV